MCFLLAEGKRRGSSPSFYYDHGKKFPSLFLEGRQYISSLHIFVFMSRFLGETRSFGYRKYTLRGKQDWNPIIPNFIIWFRHGSLLHRIGLLLQLLIWNWIFFAESCDEGATSDHYIKKEAQRSYRGRFFK